MQILTYLGLTILGYLMGAFPTGYVTAKLWRGVDVRRVGSGKTGGTNVLRSAGIGPAIVTVVVDTLKGFGAVTLARYLGGDPIAIALAGSAAVLGHNHSIFLGGMGGAGSMTNMGVLAAISPAVAAIAAAGSLLPLVISRIASLASVTLAVLTPLLLLAGVLWGRLPAAYLIYGLISSALTLWKLRHNLTRLIKGTERKIGEMAPDGALKKPTY